MPHSEARKILVVGGTGQIGKPLVSLLLLHGWQVYIVTRNSVNVPQGAIPIEADIGKPAWADICRKSVHEVDAIVYAAYSISDDVAYDRRINYAGVTEIIAAVKTNTFVFLSSIGIFGSYLEDAEYTEESAKNPETNYQCDKNEAVLFLKDYKSIFQVVILNLSIVYALPSVRTEFYRKLLSTGYFINKNSGDGIFNITHADDAAEAVILALEKRPEANRSFEEYIVNGEYIKYNIWVKAIEHYYGFDKKLKLPKFCAPIIRGPIRKALKFIGLRAPMVIPQSKAELLGSRAVFSSKKIMHQLNWRPKRKIEDILK